MGVFRVLALTLLASLHDFVAADVRDIVMSVNPTYVIYPPWADVNVVFDVTPGGAAPIFPRVLMDMKDGLGEREFGLELSRNYQIQLDDSGIITLTAKVWDEENSKALSVDANIVEVMRAPSIRTEFPEAPFGQPMDVTFSLYSGPTGSLCELTFDFGNGDVVTRPRTGQGQDARDVETVTYTSTGTYTITVTATSPLQTVSASTTIDVTNPVQDSDFTVIVAPVDSGLNDPVTVTVIYSQLPDLSDNSTSNSSTVVPPVFPENVNVLIDPGDGTGPIDTPSLFPIVASPSAYTRQISYSQERDYEVKVTVYNNASRIERVTVVQVFQDFQNPDVTKCFRPEMPRSITCQNGLEGAGNIFFAGTEIIFEYTTSNNARAVSYEITATHENGTVVTGNRTTNPFKIDTLLEPGDWSVQIRAVNPLYQAIVSTSLSLVEKIVNFQFTHDRFQKSLDEAKVFWVSFHVQGLETCLTLDFGDGTLQVYADHPSHCTLTGNFIGLPLSGALTGLRELQHTYTKEDYYLVTAAAKNRYNEEIRQLHLDITSLDCMAPEVRIYNASRVFYEPFELRRADIIKFRAIPAIYCFPYDNVKLWEIHEIDPNWGTVIGQPDLRGAKVDGAEIRLEPRTLDFEPRTLGIKLYRVTFTMRMTGYQDTNFRFTGSDYSYFRLVGSGLVGRMYNRGQTEIVDTRLNLVVPVKLYPQYWSYDNDYPDASGVGLYVSRWTCRMWRDGSVESAWPCPGSVLQQAGSTEITIWKVWLDPGHWYNITAILTKDFRSVPASILLKMEGITAQYTMGIGCAGGTLCHQLQNGQLIVRSSRLGLRCYCRGCPIIGGLKCHWTIYLEDYRWLSPFKKPLRDQDYLEHTIGYTNKATELSISSSLFQQYSNAPKIKVRVQTWDFWGSLHWTAMHFQLNEAPQGGTCTVDPTEVVASLVPGEKLFTIRCQNWVDEMDIDSYQFFSYVDETSLPIQLTWIKTPQGQLETKVNIGQGPKALDYYNNVRVVVRDTMGAIRTQEIGRVRVTRPPYALRREFIRSLSVDPTSSLEKKAREGDLISFTEFARMVANIVNSDKLEEDDIRNESGITSEYELEKEIQKNRDERAQLREKMLAAITLLPLNDVTSIDQILSCMTEFLMFPDEVTDISQIITMDFLLKVTDRLNDAEKMTSEARMQNLNYIIAAKGSAFAAMGLTGFNPTLTMMGRAEAHQFFTDYDVESTAVSDDCLDFPHKPNLTIFEAMDRMVRLSNCMIHREQSFVHWDKGKEIVQRVFSSFLDNSILDESKQFDSLHQHTELRFTEAENIGLEPMKIEGSDALVEFPANLIDIFPDGSVEDNETVLIELTQNENVPVRYTPGGKNINDLTTFVTVDIQSNSTRQQVKVTNMSRPVKVTIPRDKGVDLPEFMKVDPNQNPWSVYLVHRTVISKRGASLHVTLCPELNDVQFVVVVSLGQPPNHTEGICNASFLVQPHSSLTGVSAIDTCTTVMLDNEQLDDFQGSAYIGVRQLLDSEMDLDVSDCRQLPGSWVNGTDTPFSCNYTVTIFTSGCYFWSEVINDWSSEGLKVHPDTNERATVCEATHLTTFAGGWVVAPNTIDWHYVFSNASFERNPTLYGTEITVFVVYVIALIWARRKDKKDLQKLGLAPLPDNNPRDKYFYEIVVVTGMRRNAGTKSKVYFVLVGEKGDSNIRQFSDSEREIFRWGTADGFLMATPRSLGDLQCLRIWHDNSGRGEWSSWFLGHVTVRDVITDQKWVFVANTWLAVEEGDGQVSRVIPSTTVDRLSGELGHTVSERCRRNLTDDHLWFSVVTRPAQSRFTRVQRVSCCLCLLLTSMLANAMFYRTDSGEEDGEDKVTLIHLGPFTFSKEQVFIGAMCNLIVFPINVIIITLFRKARPRQKRSRDHKIQSPSSAKKASESQVRKPEEPGHNQSASAVQNAKESGKREAEEVDPLGVTVTTDAGVSAKDTDKEATSLTVPDTVQSSPNCSQAKISEKKAGKEKKHEKKRRRRGLPWGFRIVAWILLVLTCLTSAAFVTFYGIQFADTTCRKWISSMLVSFFMSVFITQPIKVFLMAIVLALLVKNPEDDREEHENEEDYKLNKDEVPLHQYPVTGNAGKTPGRRRWKKSAYFSDGEFIDMAEKGQPDDIFRRRRQQALPLEGEQLTAARERRLREIQTWRVVREIVIYVIFVAILLLISHRDRTDNTFLYKDTMRRTFVTNDNADFEGVTNIPAFWSWVRDGLVTGLRAGPYYNGLPPFFFRGFVNDKVSRILGYATMRQLRIKPGQCRVPRPLRETVKECNTAYEYQNQEERTFDIGWKLRTPTSTENDTAEWYRYTSGDELNSYPYWGELALYSGGGYVVKLQGESRELLELVDRLEAEEWIDKYTRVVFVEFNIYNPQVNLFGIVRIVAEFHRTGLVVPSYRLEPANLLPYATTGFYVQLACEVIFCLFILAFALHLLVALFRERRAFFRSFWNLVEFCIVALSVGGAVVYFYRLFETTRLTEQFHKTNGRGFINFQYVGYWNEIFGYILGWIVFFAILKFLRLLRFNKRMQLLAFTLRACANGLLQLSLVFWIVFLAFAALFHLTFMTIDDRYSSFIRSVVANTLMIMGKFSIDAMITEEPFLTQLIVFLYALTITLILLNMFITVLNEGFGAVRADLAKQRNDYELVDFLLGRLKRVVGMQSMRGQQGQQDDDRKPLERLPDRVDDLVEMLIRLCPELVHPLITNSTPKQTAVTNTPETTTLQKINARRQEIAEKKAKKRAVLQKVNAKKSKGRQGGRFTFKSVKALDTKKKTSAVGTASKANVSRV